MTELNEALRDSGLRPHAVHAPIAEPSRRRLGIAAVHRHRRRQGPNARVGGGGSGDSARERLGAPFLVVHVGVPDWPAPRTGGQPSRHGAPQHRGARGNRGIPGCAPGARGHPQPALDGRRLVRSSRRTSSRPTSVCASTSATRSLSAIYWMPSRRSPGTCSRRTCTTTRTERRSPRAVRRAINWDAGLMALQKSATRASSCSSSPPPPNPAWPSSGRSARGNGSSGIFHETMTMARIQDIAKHEGQQVTIHGWLHNRRSSGKIHFLQVRDGTGFIQAVMSKAAVGEEISRAPTTCRRKHRSSSPAPSGPTRARLAASRSTSPASRCTTRRTTTPSRRRSTASTS